MIDTVTVEDLFAGRGFAGVAASPLQRAFLRLSEGESVGSLITDEQAETCFGVRSVGELAPSVMPSVVVAVCGIRAGKSLMSCVAGIRCAFRADLSST